MRYDRDGSLQVLKGEERACSVREVHLPEQPGEKAAGTPMMRPLPEASSWERSIFSPGELSTRGTDGMESPSLTCQWTTMISKMPSFCLLLCSIEEDIP